MGADPCTHPFYICREASAPRRTTASTETQQSRFLAAPIGRARTAKESPAHAHADKTEPASWVYIAVSRCRRGVLYGWMGRNNASCDPDSGGKAGLVFPLAERGFWSRGPGRLSIPNYCAGVWEPLELQMQVAKQCNKKQPICLRSEMLAYIQARSLCSPANGFWGARAMPARCKRLLATVYFVHYGSVGPELPRFGGQV